MQNAVATRHGQQRRQRLAPTGERGAAMQRAA